MKRATLILRAEVLYNEAGVADALGLACDAASVIQSTAQEAARFYVTSTPLSAKLNIEGPLLIDIQAPGHNGVLAHAASLISCEGDAHCKPGAICNNCKAEAIIRGLAHIDKEPTTNEN